MDRRQFLKGLGAGAAVLIGAACAPAATPTAAPKAPQPTAAPPPTTAPAAAPTSAPAAAPKPTVAPAAAPTVAATAAAPAKAAAQGEKLVVALAQFGTETPFPWRAANSEYPLWGPIYDNLLFRDSKDLSLKPGLATSWDHSADYKTWTLKLRQGVMFHETWGEFTSEDVKWTIDQHLKPGMAGGSVGDIKNLFDKVETPDKYTVVIQTKTPTWLVPALFSPYTGYQHATSKKYVEAVGEEKAAQHPISTGPFRHVEGQQGNFHRFAAVPNHWRQTPGFKELTIRRIPDPAARVAGLRSGEIDVASVYGDYLEQAKKAGLRIFELPNAAMYWIILNGQTVASNKDYCPTCAWAGDPKDPKSLENAKKVRLALNLAVNKQAIVDGLWRGYGKLTPFSYVYYPINKGYDENWKIPPYDPQRAKQLLAEAGYPNGFEVKINPVVGLYAPDGPDLAEAVALDWEKIGIKVKRVPEEWGSFFPKTRARDTGLTFFPYGTSPFGEPAEVWPRVFHTKGALNLLGAEGPFDAPLDAINAEVDMEKRTKLQHDLGQQMYEGYYGVMIGFRSATWAMSKKVADWAPLPVPMETNYHSLTWSGQ